MRAISRREMIASTTAALTGSITVGTANATPAKKDVPGFIVFNQNVGSLPPFQAEAMCERVKQRFIESQEWIDFRAKFPNWNFLMVPIRKHVSYVEIYCEDEGQRKEIESVIMYTGVDTDPELIKDTPELRKRARDYVRVMLGAPVIVVELTDEQIDECFKITINAIHEACINIKKFTLFDAAIGQDENFLMEGVLAHATVVFAQIRRMFFNSSFADENASSPELLHKDGQDRLNNWTGKLYPQRETA
jgi:hypothetical protein